MAAEHRSRASIRDIPGNNDSYTFFNGSIPIPVKAPLMTGPTGTNVMDIQIILIER